MGTKTVNHRGRREARRKTFFAGRRPWMNRFALMSADFKSKTKN
jgi:hypothetical protein